MKRIVDIHQGELLIHNRPEGGLEAIISLPLPKHLQDDTASVNPLNKIKQSLTERF